jgi:uncharacterized glyoxalase superfamily protein PhnB
MKQFASYPVIRTNKFAQSVAFYEDMFGFVPFYEIEGYARLHHKDAPHVMMSIIDNQHEFIPANLKQDLSGQIFSIISSDFSAVYETLYMEGLEIIKEPTDIGCGIKHFLVADPYNGVAINVMNEAGIIPVVKKEKRSMGDASMEASACSAC